MQSVKATSTGRQGPSQWNAISGRAVACAEAAGSCHRGLASGHEVFGMSMSSHCVPPGNGRLIGLSASYKCAPKSSGAVHCVTHTGQWQAAWHVVMPTSELYPATRADPRSTQSHTRGPAAVRSSLQPCPRAAPTKQTRGPPCPLVRMMVQGGGREKENAPEHPAERKTGAGAKPP